LCSSDCCGAAEIQYGILGTFRLIGFSYLSVVVRAAHRSHARNLTFKQKRATHAKQNHLAVLLFDPRLIIFLVSPTSGEFDFVVPAITHQRVVDERTGRSALRARMSRAAVWTDGRFTNRVRTCNCSSKADAAILTESIKEIALNRELIAGLSVIRSIPR